MLKQVQGVESDWSKKKKKESEPILEIAVNFLWVWLI